MLKQPHTKRNTRTVRSPPLSYTHIIITHSAWWASAIGALMSVGYSTLEVALGASHAHNTTHNHAHNCSAWWASAIGALMSVGYSTLAVALGASQAHNGLGTISGRAAPPVDKVCISLRGCVYQLCMPWAAHSLSLTTDWAPSGGARRRLSTGCVFKNEVTDGPAAAQLGRQARLCPNCQQHCCLQAQAHDHTLLGHRCLAFATLSAASSSPSTPPFAACDHVHTIYTCTNAHNNRYLASATLSAASCLPSTPPSYSWRFRWVLMGSRPGAI